ncbi:MAG: geranylgeranyl diphosphate reductase [Betaproteobacteria bacterium]|jgi:geranylgeranyl reductase|nr:geranylgeranyl diphosphate reductase [Betaproteobacteria bacterium]
MNLPSDAVLFDVAVIGGGPAGATAADDLALKGFKVLLLDRAGRIKPCGGAIPPRAMKDFQIPESMLVARATKARMISPTNHRVDIPIENGYVGLVDRCEFDEWLRARAATHGADRRIGSFDHLEQLQDGTVRIHYLGRRAAGDTDTFTASVRARTVIGADGAKSEVARQSVKDAEKTKYVSAYHEIVRAPDHPQGDYEASRCDVYYNGKMSPDFYGWVFPHGKTASIGVGSAVKGFSLRSATSLVRQAAGLAGAETLRREGAPIPLKPLKYWDNGKNVVLAGDAAGVVAPASGEGIYYAMAGGRFAAEAVEEYLLTGEARRLALARKRFMKDHGRVFWVLGVLQYFWYSSDKRREKFVKICEDKDVQTLTFESYMHKKLVRKKPMAHVRIFFKDMAHLLGIAKTQ